jgi:Holliday junction resolvase RusA-like endonuclease
MSNTERITAEEYRRRLTKPRQYPPPPIFTPDVYAASGREYIIEIEPMGAPRVTRSSRFGNTKIAGAIARYDALKARIKNDCALLGYQLTGVLKIRFELSMPASWSGKKKDLHRGRPHQSKPDIDNMVKAVADAFGGDDSHVHTLQATKVWADTGKIVLFR